jgi:hypothetical protein
MISTVQLKKCDRQKCHPQNFLLNRSFSGGPGGRFFKKAPLVAEGKKVFIEK